VQFAVPYFMPYYMPAPAYPLLYPTIPDPAGGDNSANTDPSAGDPPPPATSDAPVPAPPDSAADRPSPAPPQADPPAPAAQEEATVLVFRDGHQLEVHNYAIVGGQILNFSNSGPRRIPLSDLDLAATQQVNDDRGVEFILPH
jgi:hypothetical protein